MAWSFRKRIKIAPWAHINLSRSGISTSVGPKGAKVTVGPKGAHLHTSIPGTGIYKRKKIDSFSGSTTHSTSGSKQSTIIGAPKQPSDNKGCLQLFICCLLILSLVLAVGAVNNIKNTKKALEPVIPQDSALFVSPSLEGSAFSEDTVWLTKQSQETGNTSDVEPDVSTNTEIVNEKDALSNDLNLYYFELILFIILFLFCVHWIIKQSSDGLKISSILTPTTSKSKAAEDVDRTIDKLRDQISKAKNPQKILVLNNYLGHVIKDDAEKRLKPLLERQRRRVARNPIPKNEELLKIYEEQYNSAIESAQKLIVDIDSILSEQERNNYKDFCDAFQTFRNSSKTWSVISSSINAERKSSASRTIERTIVYLTTRSFPYLTTSFNVPVFPSGNRGSCYYYPRFVICGDTIDNFEVYSIDTVSFRYEATRFIEEGVRPLDSRQVDTTYKYVNKNGGPDRRFSYNPSIPVLLYGKIIINPFRNTILVSNSDAAMSLELAFRVLKDGYISASGDHLANDPHSPDSSTFEELSNFAGPNDGTISEQYYNDLLDAAKRLIEFGNQLAKDNEFCKIVGDSITGTINWNKKILTEPKDKIPVFLWADVVHCYTGLGHDLNLSTDEGLGLLIFNTLMVKPNSQLEYRFLDLIREKLTTAVEDYVRKTAASMSGNEDIFLIEECLREHNKHLHNQYVVLLYRFASLIAKADKTISATEADWLHKIISLKEPEGVEDVITPIAFDNKPIGKTSARKTRTNAIKELNSLIGLASVKAEINTLTNYIKVQTMRAEKGMKVSPVSYHCVFTGNPGTGKTTVARIVSEIYKELGILKKGHLVETDRSGLVAEYVGQTAVKTNKIIDSALDGILFIDEAYSLVDGGQSDYGKEAIATLLKRMEDDRDRLVVILAGYTDDMRRFIESNPGLQSRFNRYIEFPDYSAEELFQIFESNTKKYEYKLTAAASALLKDDLEKVVEGKDKNFGNGRFVRNLFEKVIENQANRITSVADITADSLATIEEEDIKKSL